MATVHAAPAKQRKYESGSQRYSAPGPMSAQERADHRREALGHAIDQLRMALAVDPGSVRTYAYAACTRFAEYDTAIRTTNAA